jgi:hypothetical protein
MKETAVPVLAMLACTKALVQPLSSSQSPRTFKYTLIEAFYNREACFGIVMLRGKDF